MSARTTRIRLFGAATVALATLSLTACENGDGARDEGASAASTSTARHGGSAGSGGSSTTTAGSGGSTNGGGANSGGANSGSANGTASGGSTSGKSGAATKGGANGRSAGSSAHSNNQPCNGANTKTTATVVSRPLNHLLLSVTNTGTKNCDLLGYPAARFGEAQAVPPVIEASHPQAVVTLAPGESGYAGVLLSAGDGSGGNGYTAKSLTVHFDSGRAATPALPAKGVYVDDKLSVTYWQSSMDDALSY
ncbi:DUF4232 domain-containing protein [Streptomyces sp. NPDC002004]